mgnify:CR=1 FL=1|jgi:lauroyl/myristoyl acyltransferase
MNSCLYPDRARTESNKFGCTHFSDESISSRTKVPAVGKYPSIRLSQFARRALSTLLDNSFFSKPAILIEKLAIKYHKRYWIRSADPCVQSRKEYLALVSIFMRESLASVENILSRNAVFSRQLESRRDYKVAGKRILRYCKGFEIEQREDYQNLLQEDKRSRILASFHFGDYIYGMNTLVCLDSPGRERYVLSQKAASVQYFNNLRNGLGARAVDRSSELLFSEIKTPELSARLRNGNSTLVLFCDLPPGFGEHVEIKFLNRMARFPQGPAMLAISNRTPLLPVINYYDGRSNRIALGTQIEPCLNGEETLQAGVNRITQELISFFEYFFRKYPEQWRYVQNLPGYFFKQ